MINPHGGELIDRNMEGPARERLAVDPQDIPVFDIDNDIASDLQNIADGNYSPLTGFMTRNDYDNVLEHMRLENDVPWTIPIILPVPEGAVSAGEGDDLILRHNGRNMAVMKIEEEFELDPARHSQAVFGTTDPEHPGVAVVNEYGKRVLGGEIWLLNEMESPFPTYHLKPAETRVLFQERGWETVVAFQTRNPPHVGHEYLQKTALTMTDGLLINPVIGRKKQGDFTDRVILDSYDALIDHYYPKDRVVLSTLQMVMRYAGPREAIHHSIIRKNFGCTHFIVGRDHAGVGNYYEPFAAQEIFSEFADLEIKPFFFRSFKYCHACMSVVNEKTCPHPDEKITNFAGTMVRKIVNEGAIPPPEMMRAEVAEVIKAAEVPFVQ